MKNNVLLSIIVPIYNVEKYLEECLDSLLLGMQDKCEIILVDDGSKDSSSDICEKYAKNDARIRVNHKENGGLSSARNVGLSMATGKYITFVDSDDKVFPESIPDICRRIEFSETDIYFLRLFKLYPDGQLHDLGDGIQASGLQFQSKDDIIKYLSSRPKFPGSACGKLFRRAFLLEHDLHFPYDRRYSEDLGFIRDCILYAKSFDALDIPYYQYRQNRAGSITNQITSKNFYDLLLFITESVDMLTTEKKAIDHISAHIMSFVAYEYCVLMYLYGFLPKHQDQKAYEALKQYCWVMKYARNTKSRFVKWSSKIVGIKFTSKILYKYR